MAPVATNQNRNGENDRVAQLKQQVNPFYSPNADSAADDTYEHAAYKPYFPVIDWAPLQEIEVTDRVQHLTPAIGTEIIGIDLRQLTPAQKDELSGSPGCRERRLFRDQELNIHEQLDLGRHFGPLHKHATTPIPKEPGLEEVHVVYNDAARRPDTTAFAKSELWHSDVTYEIQPPSTTSLKVITCPENGGDTLWSSGYALYSSLSPGMQTYLEGLTALHSAVAQADGSRGAGLHVRREPVETVHPVVRVHPVTGWKSVYVNPGFTRRILGVPKAESDTILNFLFQQISSNVDFQVRFRWERNSIAFWDNRIVTHTATFDFWPQRRHALRATPHGERPESVEDYEKRTGKAPKIVRLRFGGNKASNPFKRKRVHRGHVATTTEI
ncbi:hypothetical protein JVT61DRAFT_14107 [Boletus reticuloceps]|uniref:TauD/TfdA-like domain-containing protein n=1 Tax=Boletus reticuloceps TaxID=495285 RepID=A0A8I2YD11_9AGAM|nr:hypothetical protein JVT61DRAFT_14107 [Boletus reticuloceps]